MFHVKLYRDCDTGGAHSGGLKIQGLLARQNEPQTALNQQENKLSKYEEIMKRYVSDNVQNKMNEFDGWMQEYHQGLNPLPIDPKKVFGPPEPKYRRPPQPDRDYFEIMEMLKNQQRSSKSQFEVLLDQLFSLQERKEFLESIGYIMDSSGKFYRENSTASNGELNSLFLHEITIKFKNLLLAKGTLKIKF